MRVIRLVRVEFGGLVRAGEGTTAVEKIYGTEALLGMYRAFRVMEHNLPGAAASRKWFIKNLLLLGDGVWTLRGLEFCIFFGLDPEKIPNTKVTHRDRAGA